MAGSQRIFVPTYGDVLEAHRRIKPSIYRTQVISSRSLDRLTGASLFMKCENLQRAGSFKIRGATNAVQGLSPEEALGGVATHSSGNHAQALALAARERGMAAHIVMPSNSVGVKIEAVKGYGGKITFCDPSQEAREQTLEQVMEETGATFIHPYNDGWVIAGQGTAAKELLEEVPDLDDVIAPVGGGGLLSGTAISAKALNSSILVLGAEPLGADDAFRSLREGRLLPSIEPRTIADGLRTSLSELTFAILRKEIEGIVCTGEEQIVQAMTLLFQRAKMVVEPSGAVGLAAVLAEPERFRGKRVGIILSGGNVDLAALPWTRSEP